MGRIQRIVNLRPMTREDLAQLLFERDHSPIQKLEELYHIQDQPNSMRIAGRIMRSIASCG